MRKWTYLVAALLIGGTAATVTSCIDNEEPAGITELRGAKAEFIRAKAAYEAVLTDIKKVDIEKAQVDLELKKVTLQIEQLKIAKAQAQSELDIANIKAAMEQLAEMQKAKLLELQEKTATNQELLEQALIDLEYTLATYRDNKYVAQITQAINALDGLRMTVTGAEDNVVYLQGQLLNAKAELGDAYRKSLEAEKIQLEKALETQQTVLAQVQELKDASKTDLSKEVVDIDKQIAEIDAKVLEITKEIAVIEEALRPVDDKIAEIETGYYTPTKEVTIPKVAAAIQEDFIDILKNVNPNGASKTWADLASAPFYNDENEMTADYVSQKRSLKNDAGTRGSLDNALNTLASNVNNEYEPRFRNAYWSTFGTSISGDIMPEHIQMAATKIAELEQDRGVAKGIYEKDLKAWQDALDAYTKAAKAYGYEYTPYDATWKTVTDYQALAADKQTDAEVQKVKDALIAYYTKRVPLDNPTLATVLVGTENLPLNEALSDATYTLANFKTFLATVPSQTDVLGTSIDLTNKNTHIILPADEKNYGALHTYIAANQKIWDSAINTLGTARVTPATEDEYDALVDNRQQLDGTWFKYMNMMATYEIFTTVSDWMKLEESLIAMAEEFADEVEAIDMLVEEQNVLKADKQNEKYLKEFDRAALDNSQRFSPGNPYYTTPVGKKQSLEQLRNSIGALISGTASQYTVYVYNVNSNIADGKFYNASWGTQTGTAESLAADIEGNIIDTTRALDMAKANLDKFDKGWDYGNNGNITNLEKQLADAEAAVVDAKAELERAQAKLQNLLDAYAGTDAPAE